MKSLLVLASVLSLVSFAACAQDPQPNAPTSSAAQTGSQQATTATATTTSGALTLEAGPGKCSEGSTAKAATLDATQSAAGVTVTIKDWSSYCESDSTFSVKQEGNVVHIVASKPTTVSRCVCTHERTFVIHGLGAGHYDLVVDEAAYGSTADGSIHTVTAGSVTVK